MEDEGYNSRCMFEGMSDTDVNFGDDLEVVGIVDDILVLLVMGLETVIFKLLLPKL